MSGRSEASKATANHWANIGLSKSSNTRPKEPKQAQNGNSNSSQVKRKLENCNNSNQKTNEKSTDEKTNERSPDGPANDLNPKKQRALFESPIHLFYCPSNKSASGNQDTVMLSNLLGVRDLLETYQFNFTVDLSLLLDYLHPEFVKKRRKITVITGSELDYDSDFPIDKYHLEHIVAKIPNRYGSHHSKMMINFFEDNTIEIIIMTCNITQVDFAGLTQMLWRSGRLSIGKDECHHQRGVNFKYDLIDYLKKYNDPRLQNLIGKLTRYSFLSVDVDLVASAPGQYNLQDPKLFGYGKLYKVLKQRNLLVNSSDTKHYNVLAQVSSIASGISMAKSNISSVFTHLLCPLIMSRTDKPALISPGKEAAKQHQSQNNYSPHIIFPTGKDIAASDLGFGVGQSIHFNYTQNKRSENQYNQNIKPYLRKWNPQTDISGRETTPPHVKLYMCDNGDNWSSLKWVFLGSHNLSKQAWGGGKGFGAWFDINNYEVSSYELGVLVTPKKEHNGLQPVYKTNFSSSSNPIRLPFTLPPTIYESDDKPWSAYVNFGSLKDRFNQTHHGLDID